MPIRPYHALAFLPPLLALPAWRLAERPRHEWAFGRDRLAGWARLLRESPEQIEAGPAARYRAIAAAVNPAREVGYFSEKGRDGLWAESGTPAGHARIERYYMAQSILAPALLRFDEVRDLVVVDCAEAGQAAGIVDRLALERVGEFGPGLILARPRR